MLITRTRSQQTCQTQREWTGLNQQRARDHVSSWILSLLSIFPNPSWEGFPLAFTHNSSKAKVNKPSADLKIILHPFLVLFFFIGRRRRKTSLLKQKPTNQGGLSQKIKAKHSKHPQNNVDNRVHWQKIAFTHHKIKRTRTRLQKSIRPNLFWQLQTSYTLKIYIQNALAKLLLTQSDFIKTT